VFFVLFVCAVSFVEYFDSTKLDLVLNCAEMSVPESATDDKYQPFPFCLFCLMNELLFTNLSLLFSIIMHINHTNDRSN
jgi:hypothetical protein